MSKTPRRVTSVDVARASGVSRATVSYVLNDDPRQTIPPETRERVLQAAKDLGYKPFAPARVLRSGQSSIVLGVLQFAQVDPQLARVLKQLEAGLASHGLTLIWYVGEHSSAGKSHPSSNLAPAVVLSFVHENDPDIQAFLSQFNAPVVSINHPTSRQPVGRTQAEHMLSRGFRQLVFAAPERRDVQVIAAGRLEGVQQVCAEHGLASPAVQMIPEDRNGAREAVQAILTREQQPLGICCYNDEVAFAVVAALTDLSIAIPKSVGVIGCDDIPLAQFCSPPLSTVRFDDSPRLALLIDIVLKMVQGEAASEVPPQQIELVARGTA